MIITMMSHQQQLARSQGFFEYLVTRITGGLFNATAGVAFGSLAAAYNHSADVEGYTKIPADVLAETLSLIGIRLQLMIYVYGGYLAAVGIQICGNMEKQNGIHTTAEGDAKV